MIARAGAATALLLLGGCGYHPPPQAETGTPAYQSDLAACHESAETDVRKRNAKHGYDWISAPVRRWSQIGDATGACMQGKGYGRLRWCTAAELADARRSGSVVVTAAGLQCADPATGPRRPTT